MENLITLNGKIITLIKINTNCHLNKRQKALLKLLHKCLKNNEPLNWDLMVKFYVKNVNKNHRTWNWNPITKRYDTYTLISISKSYKNYDDGWSYGIRAKIRLWFSSNMGSMILKGSILALPVIELK